MKMILKNAMIWVFSALVVIILTEIYLIEFESKLGEHSGLLIIPVAYYSACFAFVGSVVQGVFIKVSYFKMSAPISILIVGTIVLSFMALFQLTLLRHWIYLFNYWPMYILLAVPSYTLAAIGYYYTRK